jgi:type IV pilus assembly protein PilV
MRKAAVRQKGVGLLEVLLTLIVLVIGLLGMAALQARAQQAEVESYQRAQALVLLEDMVARITSNRPFRNCYTLGGTLGTSSTFSATGCDVLADEDLEAWDDMLKGAAEQLGGVGAGAMIGARGCITGADNDFLVTVVWQGLYTTVAPVGNDCGEGLFGDAALRRLVSREIRFAVLN